MKLVCEDCGTTENVKETICPYESEINGIEVKVILIQM